MLNKITFAFALLLAANVEAISLHSAGKSTGRIQDDDADAAKKDGLFMEVGDTMYDETQATAIVV